MAIKLFYNESDHKGFINLQFTPAARKQLAACPGCRTSANVELCNTHTSSYWIECSSKDCGWQLNDAKAGGGTGSEAHRSSALRVFKKWNDRA